MVVNEKLKLLYESARADRGLAYSYIDYCNTHITGEVQSAYRVRIQRFRPARRDRVFDVRNITLNAFLDRVAEWLVTGEVDAPDGPSDPLEW